MIKRILALILCLLSFGNDFSLSAASRGGRSRGGGRSTRSHQRSRGAHRAPRRGSGRRRARGRSLRRAHAPQRFSDVGAPQDGGKGQPESRDRSPQFPAGGPWIPGMGWPGPQGSFQGPGGAFYPRTDTSTFVPPAYVPPVYVPPSDVPKPPSAATISTVVSSLNTALKDPDFNRDFQQFINTKLGRMIFQGSFEHESDAKNLIKIIKSGQFQKVIGQVTPVEGPVGDVMQMIDK